MSATEGFQLESAPAIDPAIRDSRIGVARRQARWSKASRSVHVLNLGAGVQSSALLLMDAMAHRWGRRGDLESWLGGAYPFDPFDVAIFADTQDEPGSVATHLERLRSMDTAPILVGTAGRLGDDLMNGRNSTGQRFASIPAFTTDLEGEPGGITRRQCTAEYKVEVVDRIIRRQVLGLKYRSPIPSDTRVVQSFGLSWDEPERVVKVRARVDSTGWALSEFILFELQLERSDCAAFLATLGIESPRSACVFCPYRTNSEWRKMRDHDPSSWSRAVEVDEGMRSANALCARSMKERLYLHRSCLPLAQAPIDAPDSAFFNFGLECEGMCGN